MKIIIEESPTIHPLVAVGITYLLICGAVWAGMRGTGRIGGGP